LSSSEKTIRRIGRRGRDDHTVGHISVGGHASSRRTIGGTAPAGTNWGSTIGRIATRISNNGDYLWIEDTSADGKSAMFAWAFGDSSSTWRDGSCRNSSGSSTWVYCNKDFTEGKTIHFRACRYEGTGGSWGSSD
jgi:hypothetical protein